MPRIRKDQTKHQNEEERRHLENIEGTAEATANTQKTRGNTKIGGHIENLHKGGSIFVNPPKILKRQLTGYCTLPASSPMGRDNKHGWYEEHEKFVAIAAGSLSSVLLVGDSLVNGLARYHRVWSKYFEPLRALNFGVGGDRTQHVLWRIENGEIPLNLQVAFVHCGTNNLDRDNPDEIRNGIASIVCTIQEKKPNANFIVSGLLPRDQETSSRRDKIKLVNQKLRKWCQSGKVKNVHYLKPDKDWTKPDGQLVERYYFTDFLHLVEEGYEKFAKSIYEAIVKVSQGNVATTVLPKPKPTVTLPPPTALAKLKPLYKKEAKTKPKNYRPISLLPLISKIIERIIHDQTQVFLDENKILFTYQSGFRKHYSTDTCLSYLTDRVQNGFEKGSLTGMILIDLQKAFDTIDHKILTEKMSCLGFAESTIRWCKSYLTNRCFIVNVGNDFSSPGKLLCGVPQGSILGPLLLLLYVNDMPQAVNSDLLLYADDTCLIYTGKDINTIEEQLNTDFSSLCDWFIDNKLSVHFGEEKTKSILFGTKRQLKNQRDLDLRYGDIEIKQHSKVTYLGCILDNDLSGESMATKVLRLVNNRLKFLYQKQKFLTLSLRQLLCNALIQLHYDYVCSAWYPSLNKRLSKKIQTSQNKCIRYCLNLDNRAHVGIDEFIKINWLPTKERVAQCICVNIFKFFNKMSPQYMSEIFHPSHSQYNTRMATLKLNLPFQQSCLGQKTISYLGPNTWNNLAAETKLRRSVNTFKHDIKKLFFDKLKKQNDDIFFYY